MTKMIIVGGPDCSPATLILAHGARADMDTDFMTAFAVGLAGARFARGPVRVPLHGRSPPDR